MSNIQITHISYECHEVFLGDYDEYEDKTMTIEAYDCLTDSQVDEIVKFLKDTCQLQDDGIDIDDWVDDYSFCIDVENYDQAKKIAIALKLKYTGQ